MSTESIYELLDEVAELEQQSLDALALIAAEVAVEVCGEPCRA